MTTRTLRINVVAPGALQWMAGRGIGEWFEIPNTSLKALDDALVATRPRPPGSPGGKINAWCGGALRRNGSIYMIGASGGHNDYAGNEVNALKLNQDVPAWVELIRPSAHVSVSNTTMLNETPCYTDLRQASTHTYCNQQFINAVAGDTTYSDRLVVMPTYGLNFDQAVIPTADAAWKALYPQYQIFNSFKAVDWTAYHPSNDWATAQLAASTSTPRQGLLANLPVGALTIGNADAAFNLCHPITGDCYHANVTGKLWKWTRATNTWSQLVSFGFPFGNIGGQAIDPNRNVALFITNQAYPTANDVFRLDTGAGLGVTFTGLGESVLVSNEAASPSEKHPGVIFDEENDRFMVFITGRGGNFTTYTVKYVNATTYDVQLYPTVAASGSTVPDLLGVRAGHAIRRGFHNAIQYVPELKGVVMADQWNDNVHFMRTA